MNNKTTFYLPLISFITLLVLWNSFLNAGAKEADELQLQIEQEVKKTNSNIHTFFDLVFKNDYITPRGLLVSNSGLTIQTLSGIIFDLYKNPDCFINEVSVTLGIWNDFWTDQNDPVVGPWNELDWFIGPTFIIAKDWKLTAQYIEFLSPPGHFRPERNAEFTLSYDDSKWKLPIVLNPYTKLFWAIAGDSTVVVGKPGGTYYFEFGMIPTMDLSNYGLSLVWTMPTWFSVGPPDFWNGGALGLKNVNTPFGVFSTGLRGTVPLKFLKDCFGDWSFYFGVQYYYLINTNLLEAQLVTLGISSIDKAHRNVVVPCVGLNFNF